MSDATHVMYVCESHMWCHGAHLIVRRVQCEWVMSHIWMSPVAYTNESCYTYDVCVWESHVISRCIQICMSHVTFVNESCHICEWVMSHIWMNHVTYMNESYHIYEWVNSNIWFMSVTVTCDVKAHTMCVFVCVCVCVHQAARCVQYAWIMSHM